MELIPRCRLVHQWHPNANVERPFAYREETSSSKVCAENKAFHVRWRVGILTTFNWGLDSNSQTALARIAERNFPHRSTESVSLLPSLGEYQTKRRFIHHDSTRPSTANEQTRELLLIYALGPFNRPARLPSERRKPANRFIMSNAVDHRTSPSVLQCIAAIPDE